MLKKPIHIEVKPRRQRVIALKVSDRERAAMSDQAANENLASLADYIRKAALDRASYRGAFTPTQLNP